MRIGKTILDLESLTEEDLSLVIKEAKTLRSRKMDARNLREGFEAMISNAQERGLDICNKYTGEVLNTHDWVVYDTTLQCLHEGEWAK